MGFLCDSETRPRFRKPGFRKLGTHASRTSCHTSHRYQQVTGNKSHILPCPRQMPANDRNHKQQIVLFAMPHTDTNPSCYNFAMPHKDASSKSYILPCLTVNSKKLEHPYPHTSKGNVKGIPALIVFQLSGVCCTQIPANHRQQIGHLAMPRTYTSKSQESQATNRACWYASQKFQHIALPHRQ